MNTNNIYKSIIAFMLFLAPLEVLSQSDTVSNITNKPVGGINLAHT